MYLSSSLVPNEPENIVEFRISGVIQLICLSKWSPFSSLSCANSVENLNVRVRQAVFLFGWQIPVQK